MGVAVDVSVAGFFSGRDENIAVIAAPEAAEMPAMIANFVLDMAKTRGGGGRGGGGGGGGGRGSGGLQALIEGSWTYFGAGCRQSSDISSTGA